MYMYDTRLGDLDVEIHTPEEIRDAIIAYGYKMDSFEELSDEELDYLNQKYRDDIVAQAAMVQATEGTMYNTSTTKLLH